MAGRTRVIVSIPLGTLKCTLGIDPEGLEEPPWSSLAPWTKQPHRSLVAQSRFLFMGL